MGPIDWTRNVNNSNSYASQPQTTKENTHATNDVKLL